MSSTWNAFQIVFSNGAYSGKTVRFMDPLEGLVCGQLRYAINSEAERGNVLLRVDNTWYTVAEMALVEVL